MAFGRDIIYTRNCLREDNKRMRKVREYSRLMSMERENYVLLHKEYNEDKAHYNYIQRRRMKSRMATSLGYIQFLERKIQRNMIV